MKKPQLIAFALFFLLARSLYAQSTCESVVSYKWAKREGDKSTPVAAVGVEVKKLVAAGEDEAAVKARLAELLLTEKNRAMDACRREHESMADCLSAKYAAKASVLNALRFESRKAFEDAIRSDCSAQQGICTEVLSSDPQCTVKAAAAEGEGAADANGKGGKESKEGGKEKKK